MCFWVELSRVREFGSLIGGCGRIWLWRQSNVCNSVDV